MSTRTTAAEKTFVETEASLEKSGRVEELIRLYESRARDVPAAEEAAQLLTRAGDLARDRLRNFQRAEELFSRALLYAPAAREPLRGLKALYELKQDYARLAATLERMASVSSGAEAAKGYLDAAALYDGKLGKRDRAVLCCQLASRAEPRERQAFQRARAMFSAEARWVPVFESLERERAELGDREMADEYLKLAEQLVDDPSEHVLAQQALDVVARIDPQNPRLESLRKALAALEDQWRDRVRALRAASVEDRDRKAAARSSLLVAKLFAFFDPAGGAAKIKEALDRCFLLWPAMPEALGLVIRIASAGGDFAAVTEKLEKMCKDTKDKSAQAELWVRLGTIRLVNLQDRAGSLAAFEKAMSVDPSRGDAAGLAMEILVDDGHATEALALLEKHVSTVKDRTTLVTLHHRLADLALACGDQGRARTHLEASRKLEPADPLAAFRLAKLWVEAKEASAELGGLLELAASAPRPAAERTQLCLDAAALLDAAHPRAAFEARANALMLSPESTELLAGLLLPAKDNNALPHLSLVLRRAAHAARGAAALELRRALAGVLTSLGRASEAEAVWKEVELLAPGDPLASEALAALRRNLEAPPTDERSRLDAEARRLENSAADPAVLADLYRKILAIDAQDVDTLKRLGAAATALSKWDEVAVVAENLMALAGSTEERHEWRTRLAQVSAERLNRKEEAAALYLSLLAEGVRTAAVVGGLERLASQGIRPAEISRQLSPLYATRGDYQRQVASLLVQLSSAQQHDEQKSLLSLLAEVTEKQLMDSRAAYEFRLRGLSVDPGDFSFRAEAIRLARVLTAHSEHARFLVDLGQKTEDAALGTALFLEAADLAAEGGNVEDAAAPLLAALARDVQNVSVLTRLAQVYFKAGRLTDCDQVLRKLAAATPQGPERAQVLLQLAEVNAELNRPREAAQAVQEAVRAGASEEENLPRLCQLLEQGGRMAELSEALGRSIELAEAAGDKDRASRLSLKRAKVLEASLGDVAEALKKYSEVLAARPSDPDALAALEGMLQDPALREEAARGLLPAYEAVKDFRKMVGALHVIAEASQDSLERILALKKVAYVHAQHLRQPEHAFAALAQAMRFAPADASLRAAARQAAENADQVDSYAEVVTEMLEGAGAAGGDAVAVASTLHRELAEIYEKKLDDRSAAIQHLHAVLALEPKNAEALRALVRLHRAHEEWSELAKALERLSAVVPDPAEKVAQLREAASIHERRLSDLESAANAWRQISARDALDREAANALDRLYTGLDRPQELAFALELRRSQEGQSPQGRELSYRLALLRQSRLEDAAGALQLLRQILADDPAHQGARQTLETWVQAEQPDSAAAMEILDPVLAQFGEHAKRIVLRESRVANAPVAERGRLLAEIRAIYERDLGQPQAAFMAALKVFTDGIDREGVQPDLERLARETGLFEELAEIYESTAGELLPGDESIVPLLRRAAEIREQLGQTEDAIRVWKELLGEAAQDRQALDSLGRLYEKSQNAKSLSEVYVKKAQLASDPHERFGLLMKAGQAFETAGEGTKAIDAFKLAVAIRPSIEGLAALERLYGASKQHSEQADVLDQLANLATEDLARKGHLLRRALLLEKEGNPQEAVRAFGQVLSVAAGDGAAVSGLERLFATEHGRHEAARLLEPIYRKQNDLKRLVEVLDVRVGAADPALRLQMLGEIGALREALGQKALAFAARLRAFAESPETKEVRDELERVAADTGSFEELAATYEDQLEKGVSGSLALDLWRRLAVLYGERLARFDLAARAWYEVHQRCPDDLEVLDQLGRTYRRISAFKELAAVMRRQVALEPSVEGQVNHLFELASLAEDTLADKSLAAQCYQAILERKPEDPNAIKLLGRVLSETERYAELADLVVKEIQLAEAQSAHEEAFELMLRLGRLRAQRLDDPRGALTLFQEILKRRPGHRGAVGALEEMARSESPLRGEAASALEPVFVQEGDHLKLVQMLESRASASTSAQERAELYRKIADTYSNQMDSPELAFVAATRALREVPDDERSLELVLFLVDAADAADELAALLTEVATKAADDKARAALFRALARLQVDHQEQQEAVESWKRVLEIIPSDAEALDSIGRLLAKQNKISDLLEVLRRQLANVEDPARRAALLFQIGVLQDEQLKDSMAALATFRRLLEIRPADPAALERMDRLCEQQERWPELADIIARRLQLPDHADDLGLKFRLAVLRESKLVDKFGALELYTQILAVDSHHAEALSQVEALVGREPQNQAAIEVLFRAHRQNRDLPRLAQALELRVGVSADPFERRTLLEELASIREAQNEPELTYLALYRAFKEDPNDAQLRRRLETAADAAKAYDELGAAYEEELPRIAEATDAAEVCLKLGFVLDQKLQESERAAEYYEKARQLDPNAWTKALPALDRIYNQLDKPRELAAVLDALSSLSAEKQERIGLLFRLGQLSQERLNDVERATAAYERILEIEPQYLPAARQLEALYDQGGSADRLYAVLKIQRDLASGPERERILSKMAQVSSEGLSDLNHSIEIYRELLQKNPRNEQAFGALDGLLEKAGRHEELRDLLAWKLQHTVDPREVVRLNERIGRVLLRMLRQAEEAIPFFRAALERDARNRGALEALNEIYGELGKNDELVVVLRRLVPLQENAEGVKGIRVRLAEVLAAMGRREEALDAGRRALEIEPHAAAEMNRLHAVFMELKAYGDAVRSLELRAEAEVAAEDRDAAVKTLFEVADLWRGPAGKPESAGSSLERVLEIDPANRAAYEQATSLYSKANDWRAYAQVMDRYLPNLVTEEEKLASLRELAKVQEAKLGQKDVAFLHLCRALQLRPADADLREEAERLADDTGSHEELAAVLDEVADDLPRGPQAEQVYLALARIHDQKLDDAPAAEAALRRILEFDPTNESALEGLAAVFSRRGKDKEYIVALEQKLEAAGSIEKRKEILREVARVYDERLKNPEEAAGALMRALDLEPDFQTLDVLAQLHRRQKDHQSLAATLLRARDLAGTPEERARYQNEVAQVYERDLNEDEAAIEGYRTSLEIDPANAEALDALDRLYTKLDRPAELLAVYERQLELSPDYRDRVKVLFKSAAIWEDRFQNLANSDACIEGILSIDPQNLQAVKTLERLRRAQERWDELVQILDRHVQLVGSPVEQASLFVESGDVFHQHLKQVDRAVNAYHQAMELDPKCRPAMHALGTLYERSGNWPFALDMLQKEARAAGPSADAVELYFRMGKINEDMLLDPGSAKACYQEALKIDAGYLPCIRALKGIYEIEKDWAGFEKTLLQESSETEEPEAKSKALLEVARYFADRKEDRDAASQWYEEALRLVPDLLEAARPLADIYIAREDWAGAEKMLDIVAVKMADQAVQEQDTELAKELCRQLYRLGYVAEKLTKKDKALKSYEKAYQLDATYLPALEGLGNLLVQAKRFEDALKVYQTILIHHRDDLTDLEVVEIYWQLGDIHVALNQHDRAQNHFEKALAIDPAHEPSLRALVSLADQAGRFDKAAEYRQRLSQVLDGEAKFQVCLELGKLAREKLTDAYMAIDAYVAAHRLQPESLEVLDALYVLYRETKQGPKAAEVLEKMLASDALRQDAARAKRVHFALGEICRDDLKDYDRAAEAFNAALDVDYRFIDAFSAMEALLGSEKQWKRLEENYARMIQRLPKGEETHAARMTLWKALGDLYLKVLKQPDNALMAYQVVAAGLPDDAAVQETYAELAAARAGQEDKAVAAYRQALPSTSRPQKVASALAELAARRKDYDSAYLAAQVVSGLIGEPGPGEREILSKLGPYAKKREVAQRVLSDRMWQTHLFHPKIRGSLTEVMAILFEQAGHLYKEEFAKYQVNPKKHLIDVAGSQEYQIHHYRYVARLLGMEQVGLFSPFLVATRERMAKRSNEPAPDPMIGIEIMHTHPIALKVGGKFFSESGQKEVYYLLGRTMALLRPELALSQRLPAQRLEAVFQAAISLAVDKFRFTADPRAIDAERKLLERVLPEPARAALARVAREYARTASPDDLRNYLEGAELSAVRTGLFVAGEVEAVKKMVLGESGASFRVQARSKIRDLMVFALSEDLHALRVAVGTNVEVQAVRR